MTGAVKLYADVTANIIKELEAGVKPWSTTWKSGRTARVPQNAASGRPYSGMNLILLWMEAAEKGYPSQGWLTYKQANDLGARVRKGERSCRVIYTSFKEVAEEGKDPRKVPFVKLFHVFNTAQLDNLPAVYNSEPEELPEDVRLEGIKRIVAGSGITVSYGHPQPAYYPGPDRVVLPNYSDFNSANDFASTAFHEFIHATGHPSRLNRVLNKKVMGKEGVAAEECVAELGAAFLCAHLGFDYIEAQSPAYIESWLKVLKGDNRAIFSLASHASQAADWLRERALKPEAELQEEPTF